MLVLLRIRSALLVASSLLLACGEVRTLDTEFRPSLSRFIREVQPALDAQGCGRGPDEERDLAGCHTPKQGGLELAHKPGEEQVILNYRNVVPFIDLKEPSASSLLQSPLNGPLPAGAQDEPDGGPAQEEAEPEEKADSGVAEHGPRRGSTTHELDHPEYAGRFTSTLDCCYCTILVWICGDLQTEECQACREHVPCDTCQPAIQCVAGGSGSAGDAATFAEVTDILSRYCGGCHAGLPPRLKTEEDLRALAAGEGGFLDPCQSGGLLLRYVDGNNNDRMHSGLMDAGERGQVHLWVEELGAPAP